MSWQEINKKYPKAWNIYMNWFSEQNYGENLDFAFNRDLYDFFDEQGIYINTEVAVETLHCNWFYNISGIKIYSEGGYKARKEAEEMAFTKAFEILENKLKEWQ